MKQANAQIHIENLRLRTFIGFNESEKKNKQDVVINAWIDYPAVEASQTDDVNKAVNYRTICKEIIHHVETNSFLLLERLTSDVLTLCMKPSNVCSVKVKVEKPHALRFADSVSLTLSATKDTD
ncbi:D-erythro-7,8-dihydroneopterin triphosphate epimerase [Marinomonas spartinae]|uniref:Dihydroneopterin triphosphate 2'-epimerase n=1 Tax=Marinomonas spartinae TaxID=1792290 RepID=A0A1A8TEB5_9GAMM|nr:dihydroneopterin triphosphate 2'-epimerase [Marinomonas spartinae]SBS30411.1 D-erythro-7,8-dihydroneopterin triphosphate epimerase [Marinomonas spartinae]SBS36642.1 D-erythro-7,8-dihydroneopterin triphosphate epimerase [Marinomonas spartinae]